MKLSLVIQADEKAFSQFKREIAICIVRQYIEKMTIPDKFSTPASVFMASH
jgi:hypothetical protein